MAIDGSTTLWGGPAAAPCLIDSVLATAARTPDATAVVDGDTRVGYAQLLSWARRIADDLARAGSPPGGRVGIACPRGAEAVAAILAVVLSGRTYVPLDLEYPRPRLTHMLKDSGAEVVLHTGADPDLGSGATALPIRPYAAEAQAEGEAATEAEAATEGEAAAVPVTPPATAEPGRDWTAAHDPDLPVYVIYTSGSTGWPKGVTLQHSCLDNVAHWQTTSSRAPDLRTAQFAPLNFDVSFQEIFGTLCGGGTLTVVPERLRRDAIALTEWLVEQRVERLFLPYVALQMLAAAASFGAPTASLALREVNVAGEPLVVTGEITAFFAALPDCRLANHYGQSESAMVSWLPLPAAVEEWPVNPPIGRPLPGCELLLDRDDPADDVGELLVAGAPVALGYLGMPDLNARRYVTVERTRHGHTRAFRTGDLVRFTDDGLVQFVTRLDDDVKLRGIRINLAEVEAQLLALPEVVGAAAVVLGGDETPRVLRAAVLPRDPAAPWDEEAVLAALARTLPEVSVPLSVSVLPTLPRTPSGKLDRDAVAALLAAATAP